MHIAECRYNTQTWRARVCLHSPSLVLFLLPSPVCTFTIVRHHRITCARVCVCSCECSFVRPQIPLHEIKCTRCSSCLRCGRDMLAHCTNTCAPPEIRLRAQSKRPRTAARTMLCNNNGNCRYQIRWENGKRNRRRRKRTNENVEYFCSLFLLCVCVCVWLCILGAWE